MDASSDDPSLGDDGGVDRGALGAGKKARLAITGTAGVGTRVVRDGRRSLTNDDPDLPLLVLVVRSSKCLPCNLGRNGGPAFMAEAFFGVEGNVSCACTAAEIGLAGASFTSGLEVARGLEGTIPSCCHRGFDRVLRNGMAPSLDGSKVSNIDDPGSMGGGGPRCSGGVGWVGVATEAGAAAVLKNILAADDTRLMAAPSAPSPLPCEDSSSSSEAAEP